MLSLELITLVGSLSLVINLSDVHNHRVEHLLEMIHPISDVLEILATTDQHHRR